MRPPSSYRMMSRSTLTGCGENLARCARQWCGPVVRRTNSPRRRLADRPMKKPASTYASGFRSLPSPQPATRAALSRAGCVAVTGRNPRLVNAVLPLPGPPPPPFVVVRPMKLHHLRGLRPCLLAAPLQIRKRILGAPPSSVTFSEGLIFVLQPIRSSTARWWGVVDSQRLLPSENRCQFAVPSCSCPTEPGYGAYKPERCHAPKRCPDVAVCSALGHRLHCHLCRLTVALMGHPFATLPNHTPRRSRLRLRVRAAAGPSLPVYGCVSNRHTTKTRGGCFRCVAGIEFEVCLNSVSD